MLIVLTPSFRRHQRLVFFPCQCSAGSGNSATKLRRDLTGDHPDDGLTDAGAGRIATRPTNILTDRA